MVKISINTTSKKLLADIYTPVGIYLRLRDRFRDTILLESTDFHAAENSYSFICINAIGGIEVVNQSKLEYKLPGHPPEKIDLQDRFTVPSLLDNFMQKFEVNASSKEGQFAQGLFG